MSACPTPRIEAQLTIADDTATAGVLVDALAQLCAASDTFEQPPKIALPAVAHLELDTVMLPRDAFFARTADVPVAKAAGRVCAEQITPYPPGIPVVLPGERIEQPALDYLVTGLRGGMVIPDAADAKLDTARVVADADAPIRPLPGCPTRSNSQATVALTNYRRAFHRTGR